jgi:DNA-binding beta-propeller fold protein YncE
MVLKPIREIILICIISILFPNKVYVALQMLDQVGVTYLDSYQLDDVIQINFNEGMNCSSFNSEMDCSMMDGCEWMMGMCMDSEDSCTDIIDQMNCSMMDGCEWMMGMCMDSGGGMDMGNHTPHFIAIDETNGYWFVSTIASGFIARYDLETDELIDKIFVDDSPAILTLNEQLQKLYCSRMMPMGGMMEGAESTIIQEIDYSGSMLVTSNEFTIPSPAPHGISINSDGSEVYVASNTADWLYKIMPGTGEIEGVVMDESISNPQNIITQRLKPIQCESVSDSLLFVTCSGGIWVDPWTGIQEQISGKVQMWDSESLSLIDEFEFDWSSTPWHLVKSPIDNIVYVVLSGDQLYPYSSGVASLSYNADGFQMNWFTNDTEFQSLHGIDISADGNKVYVSGRGDGHLHVINANNGELINSIPLSTNPQMVMAGGVAVSKLDENLLGDINIDNVIDILDIVLIVNYILGNIDYFDSIDADLNYDGIIDIVDILLVVNIIMP